MKLRLAHRYLWFTVCFFFWRIPARIWVFLAVIQIIAFVVLAFDIPNSEAAAERVKAQGGSSQLWDRIVSELYKDRIIAIVLAPIFLALAKVRMAASMKNRSDAN